MLKLGRYVSYSDPRIYELISGYNWGSLQRSLLSGERTWSSADWTDAPNSLREGAPQSILNCLEKLGFDVRLERTGVLHISAEMPQDDLMLPTYLAQWRIDIQHIRILALEGPVETVGSVPIFQGIVFGHTEHSDGRRRAGLNKTARIVGRNDIRLVSREYHEDQWLDILGPMAVRNRTVRGTLTRARNTARRIAAAIPNWDQYLSHRSQQKRESEMSRPDLDLAETIFDDEFLVSLRL